MRLATWNVNSLKARLGRVEEWLSYAEPDVVCLQETKCSDLAFPSMAFEALGYSSVHTGRGRWNGVAILSRVGIEDPEADLGRTGLEEAMEGRAIAATCGGIRVISVYVPNGRSVGSEHYESKLAWLKALSSYLGQGPPPSTGLAVCGDFNIAPDDRDVWDPAAFVGATHVSAAEREALRTLESWGLSDAFRLCRSEKDLFTWWDYRAGSFHQHRGMRIDLILVTESLAAGVGFCYVDRAARKGSQPSDHAPVFVDIDLCRAGGGARD
ncbi:MAG: exodeoxyribonuclease III [Acidimicrobiales bacterium]